MYDTHGMSAFDGSGNPGMGGGPDLDDILAQMFGGMGGMGDMPGYGPGGRSNKPRKSPNEETKYEVTLEDLYKGKTVKFASTKNVICGMCKGRGGKEKAEAKQCSSCEGRGEILTLNTAQSFANNVSQGQKTVLNRLGPMLTQSTAPCTVCDGQGSFFAPKDKCKKCKGKKVTEEKKMLEIYIPRGAKYVELILPPQFLLLTIFQGGRQSHARGRGGPSA